jgi:hypothetical protein
MGCGAAARPASALLACDTILEQKPARCVLPPHAPGGNRPQRGRRTQLILPVSDCDSNASVRVASNLFPARVVQSSSARPTTTSLTRVSPEKPSARAVAGIRSMMRPRVNGPRSLIRTTTDFPFARFVTRTLVPNGMERCAAVMPPGSACSPLAVWPPA